MTVKTKHFKCHEFHIETALRELHAMPCWPDEFKVFFPRLYETARNQAATRTYRRLQFLADKYCFQVDELVDSFNLRYVFHFKKVVQPA